MPDNKTTTQPSKMDVLLEASDRELDYSKYDAEKQEDIRGNVASGMIDHDAIADIEGAEAIHKILLGDEDFDTGQIEGKEALEINTEAMREAIGNDASFSAPDKNKYLRTMQIVEHIQNSGFSIIRTDSGRYWIEGNENGKREYAINAIQEVADLLDKYAVGGTPAPSSSEEEIEVAGTEDVVVPKDNTNIADYVPKEVEFSSSDMYYLSGIGVDLVSTLAGLGVKIGTTAATGGIGYAGGAAISITGGIGSIILNAIGDAKNDDVSMGEMWGNILIGAGLESTEALTSVPLGLSRRIVKYANPIKKLIRYGMAVGLADTAASMEWERLLSKEGQWTSNDYRQLATLGQFVLSGVSSYAAGRHSKRVMQSEGARVKGENADLHKQRTAALGESADYKKISSDGDAARKKLVEGTTSKAKKAEIEKVEAEITKQKADAEIALKDKLAKLGTDDAALKQKVDLEADNTKHIAELDAELVTRTKNISNVTGVKSPELTKQLKESKAAERASKKDYIANMEHTKAIEKNKADLAQRGDDQSTMIGRRQKRDNDAETYAENAKKKPTDKDDTPEKVKLVEKHNKDKANTKSREAFGKRQAKKDQTKRDSELEAKEKAAPEEKKAAAAEVTKTIADQKAKMADLEAKQKTKDGLTDAEQVEYDKLKTSIDKHEKTTEAKPKKGISKLIEKTKGKFTKVADKAGEVAGKAGAVAKKVSDKTGATKLAKKADSKTRNFTEAVYKHTGMTNDALTSSSIAKVSRQSIAYGSNLAGDRIDKMDMATARKTAERLGFRRDEIGKYTLRQLQAAIKARRKEDIERKHIGGKLNAYTRPRLIAKPSVRKFEGGGGTTATTIDDKTFEAIKVRVYDSFDYKNYRVLDNKWENELPAGVKLTPKQQAEVNQSYDLLAQELGEVSKMELAKANPMSKIKPFLEYFRPSDFFMKNKMFVDTPVRFDIQAPTLQANNIRNMSGYTSAYNDTFKQPRVDSSDSMVKHLMANRFANMGFKQRNTIASQNNEFVEQQADKRLNITNQNIAAAVQAYNQNIAARNQAADTYSQEKVRGLAEMQTANNKKWGHIGNSISRTGIAMANQRGKNELNLKINDLAGKRRIYATEYEPLVAAATAANNPGKAASIKKSFMDKYQRDPDMLHTDMLNLSDEMKLFDT